MLAENDIEITMFEKNLTVADAMNKGVMIRSFLKTAGEKNIVKCLSYLIMRASAFFNVGSNFSVSQANVMAMDLLEVFEYETMEDVMMMFKLGRQGKIGGKIFRLDSNVVFNEWVPDYLELKAIEREKGYQKEKNERKKPVDISESLKHIEVGKQIVNQNRKGGGLGSRTNQILDKDYAKPDAYRNDSLANTQKYLDFFKENIARQDTGYLIKAIEEESVKKGIITKPEERRIVIEELKSRGVKFETNKTYKKAK